MKLRQIFLAKITRYNRGHLHGSINMPSDQTFLESDELSPSESANILMASKGKIIIVVGGRANNCPKVWGILHLSPGQLLLCGNIRFYVQYEDCPPMTNCINTTMHDFINLKIILLKYNK